MPTQSIGWPDRSSIRFSAITYVSSLAMLSLSTLGSWEPFVFWPSYTADIGDKLFG